jgi:hypothetical protein
MINNSVRREVVLETLLTESEKQKIKRYNLSIVVEIDGKMYPLKLNEKIPQSAKLLRDKRNHLCCPPNI